MLRNLLENVLSNKDSKIYNIPYGIKPDRAFNICKEMIQGRDIKFIRDYTTKEPYHAEAWYYGVTKVKKYQIVIWASVRKETNSIEISAASSEPGPLTGLLAELGHSLNSKFIELGVDKPIQQITNLVVKDSIIQRSNLLFDETQKVGGSAIQDSII